MMGDGFVFQLACLAGLALLAAAFDVPNLDKDCSKSSICTDKILRETEGLCGSDGIFYHSFCELEIHNCNEGESIFALFFTNNPEDCGGSKHRIEAGLRSRRAPRHVILERFSWDISARELAGYLHHDISINISVQTSAQGDSISGRGLWKIGLFRSQYEDGYGERQGPLVEQLLTEEQASMRLKSGRRTQFGDLTTQYDLNKVGCSDFRYLCVEFQQGERPRPSFTFTVSSLTGSAVLCTQVPCYDPTVDPTCWTDCPEGGDMICGSDGVSYQNLCDMDNVVRCHGRQVTIAYFGECRTGVIMESMFWSAGVAGSGLGGLSELTMEAFLFANDSSESVAGTDLWRMGVFGSTNSDGTGAKFGYIPQILEGKPASQTFVTGLPLPITARFRFPIADLGCNEFGYMCVEFSRGENAQPFFPFTTNSGHDVFVSCRQAPCDPNANMNRVGIGNVTWGVRLATIRRDAPSDVKVSVNMFIMPGSGQISGSGMWRIGLFGSPSANGSSGDRFNYVRQLLSPTESSRSTGPNMALGFPSLITQFDVLSLGCTQFKYLCIEIAKGDNPQPDFVFHNDAQNPITLCRSVSCQIPDPGSPPPPQARLAAIEWNLVTVKLRVGSPSNVSLGVIVNASAQSSLVSGEGLWRLGFFASAEADGSGTRHQYQRQILSDSLASLPISPQVPLVFQSVGTTIDVTGMGCPNSRFSYLCIVFAKGDSPIPDYELALRNGEAVTCKRISCQPSLPTMPTERALQSNQRQATFQNINVNWQTDNYRRDGLSDVRVTVNLIPDTGTDAIYGNRLWRMGLYASDSSQGTGTKYAYQRNVLDSTAMQTPLVPPRDPGVTPPPLTLIGDTRFDLREICEIPNRHPYFCVEFAKNDQSSVDFTIPIQGGIIKICRSFTCPERRPDPPLDPPPTPGPPIRPRKPEKDRRPRKPKRNRRPEITPAPVTPQTTPLNTARLKNFHWNHQTVTFRDNSASDIEVHVWVNPSPTTDSIIGTGLWRLGLFGSDSSRGTGPKVGYLRQALTEQEASLQMSAAPPLEYDLRLQFDLWRVGCDNVRYLCVEFAKGDAPIPDYNMALPAGSSIVSCKPATCLVTPPRDGSVPASAGQGPVARYSDFSASIDPYSIGSNGDARMTVTLTVNPSSNTDTISGEGLWRVGVFASNDAAGSSRYSETRNILDYIAARKYMAPNRQMQLRGSLTFPAGDLGCVYSHLCIEFAKGDSPSTQFTMQSSVSCVAQECQIHGLTARYTDFSASTNPYSADSSGNARMTITLNVNPSSNTDTITGDGLWRVGVFGSDDSRGSSRYAEIRNILDSSASRRAMRPSRPMSLPGSFDFPAADLGCVYQYFCIEFAKGNNPSTDFQMQSSVACQPQSCQGGTGGTGGTGGSGGTGSTGGTGGTGGSGGTGGTGGTGGNGGTGGTGSSSDPTVTIRSLSWAIQGQGMRPDGSTNLAVETSVSMDPSTSPFGGPGSSNLWKMGIFASSDAEGSDRYDEIPQILTGENRYREIRSGRATAFNTNTRMDIQNLGCVANKRYFCVEFGQGNSPRPRYTMRAGGGPLRTSIVSCKRQECNQEQRVVINSVRPSLITIRAGEENDVSFDVDIRQDPQQTSRIQGSNLWKLQAWGSKANTDSGPQISAVDQVLSAFQADSTLDPTSPFGFTSVRYNLDMRGRTCKEVKFLCTRIQKDRPSPDYQLQAKNNDASNLLGCLKLRCTGVDGLPFSTTSPDAVTSIPSLDPILPPSTPTAAPKPMFTVKSLGIQRVPNAAFRAGQSNRVSLTVSVNYDRARTTDISNPGWRLDVWASSKKNGKGPKVSPSRLDLGYEESRDFTVPSVLRFNNHNYDLDLNGQSCSKNTNFLCVKMTKTGAGFALKGKPRKALTKCSPINCFDVEGGGTNPGPNPPSGGGRPHVRLSSVRASFRPTGTQMNMDYYVTAAADSDVPTGKNLWHLAAFLSDRSDGSGSNKYGYTNNVLAPKQAKTVIAPGRETSITDIRFDFPSSEIGCYPYYFLCVEFGKGTATNYDMVVPATGKLVSCSRQTCQQK